MKSSAYKNQNRNAHQTARSASGVGGVGVRGLDGVSVLGGVASALRAVSAASSVGLVGGVGVRVGGGGVVVGVGVGIVVEGSWSRMRPTCARYHALTASSVLWSMSAPPSRKARSVFLFFAATLVQSRSSLTALVDINADQRASVFSSRRAARTCASVRQC